MAYFFASPVDVDIKLEGEELRKQVDIKTDKDRTASSPVYYDGDSVTGQVCIASSPDDYVQDAHVAAGDHSCSRWKANDS